MGFSQSPLSSFAEELLELAIKSGAEVAEVYQSRSHSQPVFFEANRLKQIETSQAEGTVLRLWHHGCPGLVVAYGSVSAQAMVERALALSQLNPPEVVELTSAQGSVYPDVGKHVPLEQLVAWGKESITLIRSAIRR